MQCSQSAGEVLPSQELLELHQTGCRSFLRAITKYCLMKFCLQKVLLILLTQGENEFCLVPCVYMFLGQEISFFTSAKKCKFENRPTGSPPPQLKWGESLQNESHLHLHLYLQPSQLSSCQNTQIKLTTSQSCTCQNLRSVFVSLANYPPKCMEDLAYFNISSTVLSSIKIKRCIDLHNAT